MDVKSKITNVTVYLSGAEITRTCGAKLKKGKTEVRFPLLPSQLDTGSVRLECAGAATLLSVKCEREIVTLDEDKTAAAECISALQEKIADEKTALAALTAEEDFLLSNRDIKGDQTLKLAELKEFYAYYRQESSRLKTAVSEKGRAVEKLELQLAALKAKYAEIGKKTREYKAVIAEIAANADTEVSFKLNYYTAGCGWSAYYDIRAAEGGGVQFDLKAEITQRTSDGWENVGLILSRANPAVSGAAPVFYPWHLSYSDGEPKPRAMLNRKAMMMYAAAKTESDAEALDEAAAFQRESAETAANYVAEDNKRLNTEYVLSIPYSVAAFGTQTAEIKSDKVSAEYRSYCLSRENKNVFLMAYVKDWEKLNLMDAPANVFYDGRFIGKTYINTSGTEEAIAISLGADSGITVKREEVKNTLSKVIGNRLTREYKFTVKNCRQKPASLTLTEPLPISDNKAITITAETLSGAKTEEGTGKLLWELELKPNETKEIVLRYTVAYPKNWRVYL